MWTDKVSELIKNADWPVGLLIKNLVTGQTLFSHRPDEVFPSCSVIKVPIMLALFDEAAAGRLSLSDSLPVSGEDYVEGSGFMRHMSRLPMTLRDHALLMIAISDNSSTNHLISVLGMRLINEASSRLGLKNTILNRKMMDLDARAQGLDNFTTCADMAILFEHLYNNPERYRDALHILKQQQHQALLGGLLDADAFEFAHKTGGLPKTRLDVGIMYLKDPVFISLMMENLKGETAGIRLAHEIGLLVYEKLR